LNDAELQKQLLELNPPLHRLPDMARTSLKNKHINVLTTVLHRCMLEGDFARAGHAWGLLLKTKVKGKLFDYRVDERWGIGAEILLRRHTHLDHGVAGRHGSENSSDRSLDSFISEEAFKQACEYYEYLIKLHRYRWFQKEYTNETDFYPPLFSVLIKEAVESSKQARKKLDEQVDLPSYLSAEHDFLHYDLEYSRSTSSRATGLEAIRKQELTRAQDIAARIDKLLEPTAIFDGNAEILQLRGMVALWISDLLVEEGEPHDLPSSPDAGVTVDSAGRSLEIRRASELFKRSEAQGGHVWAGVTHIRDMDDTEERAHTSNPP